MRRVEACCTERSHLDLGTWQVAVRCRPLSGKEIAEQSPSCVRVRLFPLPFRSRNIVEFRTGRFVHVKSQM